MIKKTYHIYFENKCIFKNLDEEEFQLIWGRIYKSYYMDDISYEYVEEVVDNTVEHSY
tara:strand:- start:274 stop:447 length:174 start_codon:yes stop_codon:yes gene_type:complete